MQRSRITKGDSRPDVTEGTAYTEPGDGLLDGARSATHMEPSHDRDGGERDQQCSSYDLKSVIYLLIAMAAITCLVWFLAYHDLKGQSHHLSTYKEVILQKICDLTGKMEACIKQFPELELGKDLDELKELVSEMADSSRRKKE